MYNVGISFPSVFAPRRWESHSGRGVCAGKSCHPEGNYRHTVAGLAWEAMMDGKISAEDYELYWDWFFELAEVAK